MCFLTLSPCVLLLWVTTKNTTRKKLNNKDEGWIDSYLSHGSDTPLPARWTADWHRLGCHAVEGVIRSAEPSLWICAGTDCWGSLSSETVMLCRGAISLSVMLCRLASAASSLLRSAVNHCPSPPFYPGASLFLTALKGLVYVWALQECSGIPRTTSSLESSVRNVLLSQKYSYCNVCNVVRSIFSPVFKRVNSREAKNNIPGIHGTEVGERWEDVCKQSFTKGTSDPPAAPLHLTDESGKIGHTHQKCALPSDKPQAIGELFRVPSSLSVRFAVVHSKWLNPFVVLSTCREEYYECTCAVRWKWLFIFLNNNKAKPALLDYSITGGTRRDLQLNCCMNLLLSERNRSVFIYT